MPTKEQALAAIDSFIDSHREELVQFAVRLVQAKSVNPPGDEREAAAVALSELERWKVPCKMIDHGGNYRSVIAELKGDGSRKGVLLNGHLDTVPPGESPWNRDPYSGEIAGGKLWGRGASDMKAGDAAMTYAMLALRECGMALKGDLVLTLTAAEETMSVGARAVASDGAIMERVDKVLIAEPSDLRIFTAEKGAFWLRITAHGKTAHGSMPHKGVNAIQNLCDLLARLRREWDQVESLPVHPILGSSTASVNLIGGGVGTNVVPDGAWAAVDMRTIPGQDHGKLLKRMKGWAAELSDGAPGLSFDFQIVNDRAPFDIAQDHPVVKDLQEAGAAVLGREPELLGAPFYTDASVFCDLPGLAIVIFGPGETALAHQPNEYCAVEEIPAAAKVIARWALEQLF